jgi:hypothetical protein
MRVRPRLACLPASLPVALCAATVAAAATIAPLGATLGAQQAPTPIATPDISAISVSGTGESRVTPDRAFVTIGVETRRPTAAQAGTENARQTRNVIDAVRGAGIAADDISTTDYSVTPDYQYDQPSRSTRVTGYIVRNAVRVRVLKLDQTGAVLDAALSKGANTIHGVELVASTLPSARREALANAVEQAKADAEVMARAAGGTLGPLLEMSSGETVVPVFEKAMMVRSMAAAADAATPIAGGQQTVQARVSARWRFIPGR